MDPAASGNDKIFNAFTASPISRLNRYAMPPPKSALIHVTNITPEGLIVADMWQFPEDKPDFSIFAAEIAHAMEILRAPENMKRKAETMDDIFPPAKLICSAFDIAPTA